MQVHHQKLQVNRDLNSYDTHAHIKLIGNSNICNSKCLLQHHSADLTNAIAINVSRVANSLHAKELIPLSTKEHIITATGISDHEKSSRLMIVLQRQLEASLTPDQYLIDICHVLINQQHQTLTDIATNILHQLGE